jgi:hypothetical protein
LGDLTWGVSAGVLHRRLVERAPDGTRLVKESGPLLRLGGDARLPLAGGGALQGTAGVAAGQLDYQGQNQLGMPLTTDSNHRDVDLALAWRPLPAAAWGEGWLVLRAMRQERRIESRPTAVGLRETSTLVMPGVRWTHAFDAASWRWQPSVELRASAHHRVDIGFNGVFDDTEIKGGRRHEVALGLEASAPNSPWSYAIEWTHTRQSASPRQGLQRGGAPAGTVFQPRIGIDDVGVRVRRAF